MQPILFRFGSVAVDSYGLLFGLSFLFGSAIFVVIGRSHRVPLLELLGIVFWFNVSAVVGSRLLFLLNNPGQWRSAPGQLLSVVPGGFYFYGGFVLTTLVVVLYARARGLAAWEVLDYWAPALALGMALMRAGCFLGGCCYGRPTGLAWGVEFPIDSIPALRYGLPHSIHPAQLYAAALGLVTLAALLWLGQRRRFSGQVFLAFCVVVFAERALNLTRRGDLAADLVLGLPQSQVVGGVLLAAALASWIALARRARRRGSRPAALLAHPGSGGPGAAADP